MYFLGENEIQKKYYIQIFWKVQVVEEEQEEKSSNCSC